MYAMLGFGVAGILFLIFALSFNNKVVKGLKLDLSSFVYAYACLAAAFFGWAMAPVFGSQEILVTSLIVGNALFLLGTIFMLRVIVSKKIRHMVVNIAGLIAASLFAIRIFATHTDPYMDHGVLVFNSSQIVSVTLALLVVAIWLPANISVAKKVVAATKMPDLGPTYTMLYIFAALSSVIFLAARKPLVIALSFTMLIAVYVALIWSNYIAKYAKESHGK